MEIKKPFFYNRLETNATIDDEAKQKALDFFEIVQFKKSDALSLDHMNHQDPVSGAVLLLCSYEVKKASNGNDFLHIVFNNAAGSVAGRMFNDNKNSLHKYIIPKLEEHGVFEVDGAVNEFNGGKSINIKQLTPHDDPNLNLLSLLPASEVPVEDMLLEMLSYMNELAEPHRSIALKGLQTLWREFSIKPAAIGHHHAYIHGLLKHTLGLMRIARYIKQSANPYDGIFHLINIAEEEHKKAMMQNLNEGLKKKYKYMTWSDSFDHIYNMVQLLMEMDTEEIDWDLIISAIFYHDVGKIFEYSHAGEWEHKFSWLYPHLDTKIENKKPTGITMDENGQDCGHMVYGTMVLNNFISAFKIKVPTDVMKNYTHCILAHHGKLEWGANVKPATPEAVIVHLCDLFDSRWEKDDEVN